MLHLPAYSRVAATLPVAWLLGSLAADMKKNDHTFLNA
jgi:hypothetical protein